MTLNTFKSSRLSFTFLAALMLSIGSVSAQDVNTSSSYKAAIGLRAGGTSGITGKVFVGNSAAVEGILSVWRGGLGLTVLYERYTPAFNLAGMNWYYGGGGHAIVTGNDNRYGYERVRRDQFALGIDGIVGLEYKIPPIPIALSLDLKPNVEVWSGGDVDLRLDPGIGLKFVF